MLNLTHLKVLEAVARHGSVTEAAKELHYSQPSVSHHVGRLEAATESQAHPTSRPWDPTHPEGELLARRAAEVLGRVDGCDRDSSAAAFGTRTDEAIAALLPADRRQSITAAEHRDRAHLDAAVDRLLPDGVTPGRCRVVETVVVAGRERQRGASFVPERPEAGSDDELTAWSRRARHPEDAEPVSR